MSDPIGKCRSNYFEVKDRGAFEAWILQFDVELVWVADRVPAGFPVGLVVSG